MVMRFCQDRHDAVGDYGRRLYRQVGGDPWHVVKECGLDRSAIRSIPIDSRTQQTDRVGRTQAGRRRTRAAKTTHLRLARRGPCTTERPARAEPTLDLLPAKKATPTLVRPIRSFRPVVSLNHTNRSWARSRGRTTRCT